MGVQKRQMYRGSRGGSVGDKAGKGFGVAKIAGYPQGMWGAGGRRKMLRRGWGDRENF